MPARERLPMLRVSLQRAELATPHLVEARAVPGGSTRIAIMLLPPQGHTPTLTSAIHCVLEIPLCRTAPAATRLRF